MTEALDELAPDEAAPDPRGIVRNFHGRRSGKPIAAYQRELVRTLLPHLSLNSTRDIDPGAAFAHPIRDAWLEIGFGAGEHLLATAAANPDIGLIGCEPFLNGMARTLADLAGADLHNVRLFGGDAGLVVDRLPAASLGRVFLFYPDPWPKRRQRKRRFLSDAMLARLARVMRAGAELRFATDIDDKCGWALARILRSPEFAWTAAQAADWQAPWPGWVETRYEQKAKADGRRPCYITAIRR